ncbi:hypothetical protein QAD02_008181 [Eretmocerus hayati]|uniref:Uncharacterized protein n=1 Tax=Eretmocerus hayati TaxID=131215 RepID=A0ACC2N5R3_9HYME|nr:hypothetical protein QAD02_008181 [Eretmocerus hayati]
MMKLSRNIIVDDVNVHDVKQMEEAAVPESRSLSQESLGVPRFTPTQALAIFNNANMTVEAFTVVSSAARDIGNNLFPTHPAYSTLAQKVVKYVICLALRNSSIDNIATLSITLDFSAEFMKERMTTIAMNSFVIGSIEEYVLTHQCGGSPIR